MFIPIFHGQNRDTIKLIPPEKSHLIQWLDANSVTLSDVNKIDKFIDMSDYSNDATFSSGTKAYVYKESSLFNNKKYARIWLSEYSHPSLDIFDSFTCFYVLKDIYTNEDTERRYQWYDDGQGAGDDRIRIKFGFNIVPSYTSKGWGQGIAYSTAGIGGEDNSFIRTTNTHPPGSDGRIHRHILNNLYKNSVEIDPYYTNTIGTKPTNYYLNRLGFSSSAVSIAELLIYDIELGSSDIIKIETYLNDKYKIY